jgi:ABC-type Fe3+/spermidine/putrescine transport system ATPase subunit
MYSDQNLGNFRVHIVICSTTHRVVRVFDFDNFKFSHKLKLDFFSRLTLLLGSPGSGETTLLKALAGKLDPKLRVEEQ